MKLKHIIIGLVSMLGIGAAVGAVNIHANQEETKVVEAASSTSIARDSVYMVGLYNEATGWFSISGYKPSVHYWGNNIDATTIEISKVNNNLGYFVLPKGTTGFKFLQTPNSITLPYKGFPSGGNKESGNLAVEKDNFLLKNFAYISDYGNNYTTASLDATSYTFAPIGSTLYFDCSNASFEWMTDNPKIVLKVDQLTGFYGYSNTTEWFELNRVGKTKIFYLTTTKHILCTYFRFTRYNPSKDPSIDGDGGIWNRTSDVKSGYDYSPFYILTLKGNKDSGNNENWDVGDKYATADAYSKYFTNTMICDGNGHITSDGWAACETQYNSLHNDTQGVLWTCNPSDADAGQDTKDAMAKYDYIIHKYTKSVYEDFIGRTNQGGGYQYGANVRTSLISIAANNNGAAPIIISVIAVISLTAIGGYYFLSKNKKKENQ